MNLQVFLKQFFSTRLFLKCSFNIVENTSSFVFRVRVYPELCNAFKRVDNYYWNWTIIPNYYATA